MTTNDPRAIIDERHKQHGDWMLQSCLANDLKSYVRMRIETTGGCKLMPYQQEAIEMILTKVSRICCGNANHADHWDDIAGYAYLGKGGHDQ